MSSPSDDFKHKIETFLQVITGKLSDSSVIQDIENEYNTLMDLYWKLTIMSNEDLEGIESEITNLNSEVAKLNSDNGVLEKRINELLGVIKNHELKSKIDAEKVEGLNEKIKILQSTLDSYSNKSNETDFVISKMNQTITDLKNENSNLMNKYHTLLDEMEINNKNVKKNFTLEVTIKQLTEENEKLAEDLKKLQNSEDFKIKFLQAQSELKEMKEKYELLNNSHISAKNDNEKLSSENFEKFNIINNLENEGKIKNHKIEEMDKDIKNLKKQIGEYENKLKESDHALKTKKTFYENQMKELKKEVDRLVKSNEQLKKESADAAEQLKKFQHYTNFAKASKENLSKKDFSILETMSRRVEELSEINENYKQHIHILSSENDNLKQKNNSLETLIFHYMKDDVDIMRKRTEDTHLTEEEIDTVKTMISKSDSLTDIIYLLKKENFNLQKQLTEITIECNKLLRTPNNK